jgi:PilZ domain
VTTLHVITSDHHPVGETLVARVVDVSAGGVGFTSESALAVGDRLRVDANIEGITVHAEATVVQTSRAAFVRFRAGRQFRHPTRNPACHRIAGPTTGRLVARALSQRAGTDKVSSDRTDTEVEHR